MPLRGRARRPARRSLPLHPPHVLGSLREAPLAEPELLVDFRGAEPVDARDFVVRALDRGIPQEAAAVEVEASVVQPPGEQPSRGHFVASLLKGLAVCGARCRLMPVRLASGHVEVAVAVGDLDGEELAVLHDEAARVHRGLAGGAVVATARGPAEAAGRHGRRRSPWLRVAGAEHVGRAGDDCVASSGVLHPAVVVLLLGSRHTGVPKTLAIEVAPAVGGSAH
mmetsp:Transcript_59608/g.184803  ORF Transcript_59608/g.184803 Transcript_59608/m.184803 type:complete len:224 (+) Transcript_59608:323-994(+)